MSRKHQECWRWEGASGSSYFFILFFRSKRQGNMSDITGSASVTPSRTPSLFTDTWRSSARQGCGPTPWMWSCAYPGSDQCFVNRKQVKKRSDPIYAQDESDNSTDPMCPLFSTESIRTVSDYITEATGPLINL